MDKLQKARFDLFNMMRGRVIPAGVMADIRYAVDEPQYLKFKEIYDDEMLKFLLVVNDNSLSGIYAFWDEVFPNEPLNLDAIEFLRSKDFAEIKVSWKDELTNFIRNEAKSEKRPYLVKLADALYVRQTNLNLQQVLADMLQKQVEVNVDYDVYWGFCLLFFSFDLMTEELFPQFYEAVEKHKNSLIKL